MKILLAIDDSPCSEAAVQAVIRQFRPDDAEVCVLHADEWPKGLPTSLPFTEGPQAATAVLDARAEARRRDSELVAAAARQLEAARFRVRTEIREGDPERAILESTRQWHPDLIVVGSHGRTALNRFLEGSVSERVYRHAPASVQVVRG
jgi:nucleotide-binding universal stress UspA family protein